MRPSSIVLALKSMLTDLKSIFHRGDSVEEATVGEVVVGEVVVGETVVGEGVIGEAVVGEVVIGEAVIGVIMQVLVVVSLHSAQKGPLLSLMGCAVVEHAVPVKILLLPYWYVVHPQNVPFHEHRFWLNFEAF